MPKCHIDHLEILPVRVDEVVWESPEQDRYGILYRGSFTTGMGTRWHN